ncbi:hypothetical protein HK405_013389 [Cladochytrium tenue]|nr:hypothetical protein HK405_013389 [Cladochytrium tenue]
MNRYLLGTVSFAVAAPLSLAAVAYMLWLYGLECMSKTYPRLVVINSIGAVIQNVPLFLILTGDVVPAYPVLYTVLVGWIIVTQTLYHIILNRTSVMWRDRSRARASGLWLHAGIAVINVSVLIIWPSAQLGTWATAIAVNNVWDKVEKFLFMGVDVVLNALFVMAFRRYGHRLGGGGGGGGGIGGDDAAAAAEAVGQLYGKRFARIAVFGEVLAALGLLCDVLIVVLMFQPDPLLYTAGHVLAAPVKLWIEICMADLVRALVARGGGDSGVRSNAHATALELESASESSNASSVSRPWAAEDKLVGQRWSGHSGHPAAVGVVATPQAPVLPVKLHQGLRA